MIRHLLLAAALALAGCAATDVEQVRDASFIPAEDEQPLWKSAEEFDAAVADSEFLYEDPALTAYLDEVSAGVLAAFEAPGAAVKLRVLENPFLNAFALPNGSIYLHSGLLAQMTNEAQLATVISHELAHFLDRHALRERRSFENSRTAAATVGLVVGVLAVAAGAPGLLENFMAAAEETAVLQVHGYGRELEHAADQRAVAAVAAGGYDAREATALLRTMLAEELETPIAEPYEYATHPRLTERIETTEAAVDAWLATGVSPAALRIGSERYDTEITALLLMNAELDRRVGRFEHAHRGVTRHLAAALPTAEAYLLLARIARETADDEAGLAAARRALEHAATLEPDDARVFRELGLVARRLGRREDAQAAFTRFIALEPEAVDRSIIERYLAELVETDERPDSPTR